MKIAIQYDEIDNSEYRFISTGRITSGVRFVMNLGEGDGENE